MVLGGHYSKVPKYVITHRKALSPLSGWSPPLLANLPAAELPAIYMDYLLQIYLAVLGSHTVTFVTWLLLCIVVICVRPVSMLHSLFFLKIIFMCICLSVCMHVCVCGSHGGQKRLSDPVELQL